MKYVIPAKDCSERVPSKNWRHFSGGQNLVERTIGKLWSAGVNHKDIYVSCENPARLTEIQNRYHEIRCILRDPDLCGNDVPIPTWIRGICDQVPGDNDIAWCQVCDPLFDEYKEVFAAWADLATYTKPCDSLVVRYRTQQYLMSPNSRPFGWAWGMHHTPSTRLPAFTIMPFTLSILTRQSIKDVGYHIGANPMWYTAKGNCLDIDTEFDFKVAQAYLSASACTLKGKS